MNNLIRSHITLGKFSIPTLLVVILLVAAFMRLFRISDYMTFLGDEGRDVLVVKQILSGDFTLLGPRSSAADFYYGPVYYYMITPFLWLFNYDPVGPAVFIAILGIFTVYLIYYVGKTFFNHGAGLIASGLYAIAPVIITYSRSSWNPNPLPLVSLGTLFLLYKAIKQKKLFYFGIVGFLLGIGVQMQYLALFLAMIVAVFTLLGTIIEEKKNRVITLIKRYITIFIGFLIGFAPFLGFEVLHGFPNSVTIINFALGKYSSEIPALFTPGEQVTTAFIKLFGRLVLRTSELSLLHIKEILAIQVIAVFVLLVGIISTLGILKVKDKTVQLLFLCWLVLGVGLFSIYKKEIYDYYLGFMFPLPFLLIGNLLTLPQKNKIIKVVAGIATIALFLWNFYGIPFRFEPNKQKEQVKTIAEFVLSKTDGQPYNFALITPGNSDHAYRYFFEVNNRKPVEIQNSLVDPERKTVTDQLLIVCEDIDCQPLGHPLFEVAGFGRAVIAGSWDVSVVKIYKLVPYKENK